MPPKFLSSFHGPKEDRVAPGSGVARRDFRLHLVSNQTAIVNAGSVGVLAAWTALTLNGRINPYGGTLVVHVVQATPNAGNTIQLRIKGVDQFHEYVEELTPVVTLASKTNNFIYLAQPFTYVQSVEYLATGLEVGGDSISVGSRWDWTRTIDGTNEHLAGRNLGFCLPIRTGRVLGPKRVERFSQHSGPALSSQLTGAGMDQNVDQRFRQVERHAAGAVVMTGNPSNNETITVDGRVYTWKTALTPAANEVFIGASASANLDNLAAAINKAVGLGNIAYGDATTVHATVMAGRRGLSGANQALMLLAREPGTLGNTLTLTEASSNTTVTAFGGGLDAPHEVQGINVYDITGAGLAGALTHLLPTEFGVGVNVAGWVPVADKIHVYSQTSVAQWATTDNILVTMHVRSADPPT